MNSYRRAALICAICLGSPLILFAEEANENDPRFATVDYRGSGIAEHAPEYGEAFFQFQVQCRTSAADVRTAIQTVSKPIWDAILKEVPELDAAKDFSETRARFAGETGNITESPGSRYEVTAPTINPKTMEVTPGKTERLNVCSGEAVALDAKVATVFAGNRRFGVRTENLAWLEGLVRTVNAHEKRGLKEPGSVEFSATPVEYRVKRATLEDMLLDVQTQARDSATGKNSLFASDKEIFQFASATPIGRQPAAEPIFLANIGHPLKRGAPPKVTLDVEFAFTIYAESQNAIPPNEKDRDGGVWTYPISGRAVLDADFAESTVTLKTTCHDSATAAAEALAATADSVVKELQTFHGEKAATETDRFTQNQPAAPSEVFPPPYLAVAWDTTKEDFPVTKYLNTCTLEQVAAPDKGGVDKLPPMFQASQVLSVRSSRFNDILTLVEKLQTTFDVPATSTDAVDVSISNAVGDAAQSTKLELERLARADAAKQAMAADGQVATDARTFRYTEAYFRGLAESFFRAKAILESAPAPFGALSNEDRASDTEDLNVEVVTIADDERPVHRMVRHYIFRYEVRSKNYVELPAWAVGQGAARTKK